jgi:hypothetical protein
MKQLSLPAVLAVAVITSVSTVAVVTSCGGDDDPSTCDVYCVPDTSDENCQAPDLPCATGPNLDQCPPGCSPEPVA